MSENNQESFDDQQTNECIQNPESQTESNGNQSAELNSDDKAAIQTSKKCLLWANWHIFVAPGRMREAKEKDGKNNEQTDDDSEQDDDRFIPKTTLGRQIGVMQFVFLENGKVSVNEMLCIDIVLRRITMFTPQMAGVDRYDDWGVLQCRQEIRRFVEDFFILSPQKRRRVLSDFDNSFNFSPEINTSIWRLKNLVNLPRGSKKQLNSEQDKPLRCWPKGLVGRDLELFKLFSGMETMSPRNQALSVLNYILPEESGDRSTSALGTSDSSNDPQKKELSKPIRFESDDKKRIKRLLKRFPPLKNRYPYLLMMIENEIPISEFNFDQGDGEYIFSHALPASFYYPSILSVSHKKTTLSEAIFDELVKWVKIAAILFLCLLLAGILFAVFTA